MARNAARTGKTAPPPGTADRFDERDFTSCGTAGEFFVVRNLERLRNPEVADAPGRTIVILGTGRSGTTMTAGVLLTLGVEFGDDIDEKIEDRAINEAIVEVGRSFLLWRILTLRRTFKRLMRERVERCGRWGFKAPLLTLVLFMVADLVPDPVYVVVTRNALDTSVGSAQSFGRSWRKALLAVSVMQLMLTTFALATRRPVLLFSYERALRAPDRLVDALSDVLSIDADEDMRHRATAYVDPSKGYRPLRRLHGHVGALTPDQLRGWVRDVLDPGRSVDFEVRDGETVLATGRADRLRPDVRAAGFHDTGRCGFDVRFDPPLDEEVLARLSIHVPAVGRTFWTNRGESR